MALPIMAKATAVWLIDNTTLSFNQIAEFCGLHELEVSGIADGEVAVGIKGFDPIANNQLTPEEIKRCEDNPKGRLQLKYNPAAEGETKRKGPRYTPLSKRQDRPSAIAWLVKFHPELTDGQISKLVGTTKPTIQAIRDRTHWNISNIQPIDPVALGMCKQVELDNAVAKASKKKEGVMTDDERMRLVSTEQSLQMGEEPRMPSNMSGLENFSLSGDSRSEEEKIDPNSLFNLPNKHEDDDEDDN
ncbi:MAG TPA: cell cycle transcriptional regulator TrcR [Paracoccaceae bacterium]|nr:cell cycle transcriptional regulator TrcR [Paracoccaceae bacterium]